MVPIAQIEWLPEFIPSLSATILTILLMYGVYRTTTGAWERSVKRDVVHSLTQLSIGLIGTVLIVLLLPLDEQTRQNVLTAGGLILTAVFGFSSTTVIRDAAAGIALRFMNPFRRGDYIKTESTFGRVSEIGIFHTELQSEERSFVTVTNTKLLNQSFEVIPATGTILSTTLSLGYDLPRQTIEEALLDAAEKSDLRDPFVHIEDLGDFSITYKVAGLLEDTDNLLTARSDFRKTVLDTLHEEGIEIVSPIYQNQRKFDPDTRFLPKPSAAISDRKVTAADQVVFDKALKARRVEDLEDLMADIESRLTDKEHPLPAEEQSKLEQRLASTEARKEELEERLDEK